MTPADVLDKAADVIVERGWCQYNYEDRSGHVCVKGAINLASNGTLYADLTASETTVLLADHLGIGATAAWNDDPARTADEVITALCECAASLRASYG